MKWNVTEILAQIPCTVTMATPEDASHMRFAIYRRLRRNGIDNVRVTRFGPNLRLFYVKEPEFDIIKEAPQ